MFCFPVTITGLVIIFASYDEANDETTIGYYVDGAGSWSTSVQASWTAQSATGASDNYYFGGNENKSHKFNFGAFAVFDQQITTADLAGVVAAMGLT